MNELIKELAKQAHQKVIENTPSFLVTREMYEQKFAELIVKECCQVLGKETIRHDGYGYNQHALYKKIREHFGVEE